MISRRVFSQTLSAGMIAARGFTADKLPLHIGHTGLTWIPLGAALGFYGIELFGNQIEAMEAHGGEKQGATFRS
jgi:hypothetical protein